MMICFSIQTITFMYIRTYSLCHIHDPSDIITTPDLLQASCFSTYISTTPQNYHNYIVWGEPHQVIIGVVILGIISIQFS